MIINRVFAMASHQTFTIPPIRDLVTKYVGDGIGWADPYAGYSKFAQFRNDLDPSCDGVSHQDALDFVRGLFGPLNGVLFDPPYSYRQISEHYKACKRKVTQLDTSYNFYRRVMDELAPKVKVGGHTLSFGWNSNGFGKKAGFKIIEILLVGHGCHHNDTICTVEEKI